MKIAMIGHKRVPGREGGVEVVVEELSTRMVKAGHQVTLYNRANKAVRPQKEFEGVRLVTVPTVDKKSLDAVIYSFLASIHALFCGYDVIHYHALGPSVMLAIPHFFGKYTVATVHGLDWQRAKWGGGFASLYLQFGERIIAKYADQVIVLSQGVQQYFREKYDRTTLFLPNGVEVPKPHEPQLIEKNWGLKKGGYILFLARIVPEKGLHYLLDAFHKIDTDMKLVIAGGDSHSNKYYHEMGQKALQDDRVILTGFVQDQVKAELFTNAAMYVLPSDIEGMPISLLEAMSYGIPCITSDIAENLQVLGKFGDSFAAGNVDDLQFVLEKALVTPPVAGAEQAEMIANVYSWDVATRKTLEIYEET